MRLFGLELTVRRAKSAVQPMGVRTWMGGIFEWSSGAWQRHLVVDSPQDLLSFSPLFACVSLVSRDIGKLGIRPLRLVDGVWLETASLPVLRRPNRYQSRTQFLSHWIVSKLLSGNTYVLKERDERGKVRALYILDPRRVRPMVAPDGDVFYQIGGDNLAGITDVMAPASEIIHDRHCCLFHPLVGVSPIYASAASGTQGRRIQANSASFFENMSRPSGQLTGPGAISDATAARLKGEFEKNFSGENIGRILVSGDGLKFEPFSIAAEQAQLVEQLKWVTEDVARCFHVPLHKLGAGPVPTTNNVAALEMTYYQQALQPHIEDIENLLDDGLELPEGMGIELDTEALIRMDPLLRAQRNEIGVRGGYLAPNEARRTENLPPVDGGDTPYMQQQMWSLRQLSSRSAPPDSGEAIVPEAPPSKADWLRLVKFMANLEAAEGRLRQAAESDPDFRADSDELTRARKAIVAGDHSYVRRALEIMERRP